MAASHQVDDLLPVSDFASRECMPIAFNQSLQNAPVKKKKKDFGLNCFFGANTDTNTSLMGLLEYKTSKCFNTN